MPRVPGKESANEYRLCHRQTVVAVDPVTAFAVFTSEIAAWWKPKVPGLFRRGRSGTLKFDGGRLLEIDSQGEPFEIGTGARLGAGQAPGRRMEAGGLRPRRPHRGRSALRSRAGGGTRVTVEHRGWDALAANHPARHGYTGNAFTSMIGLRWADALTSLKTFAPRPPINLPA